MIELERIGPDGLLDHGREISEVWTDVTEERLREILPRHAGRRGFRFLAARSSDGTLAGFAYGYLGAAGEWWHDIVADAMSEGARERWLAPGHFEFVELHVRRECRRRGVGGRLHDALLAGLASPTAVLSTQTDNGAALHLYHGRGWEVVVERLRFAPGGREFCVLGLDLAARRVRRLTPADAGQQRAGARKANGRPT